MGVFHYPVAACLLLFAAPVPLRLAPHASGAGAQGLPRGRVVEKVACQAKPDQSYALYLPSGYSPDRRWPILYAFDAGARGVLPVERFREAAERYGYIVVGSNNSRNGPIEIANDALNAMLADAASRFAIDDKRVYVTGFSGGARVASMAGVALKAAGVIGCGAGFHPSLAPSSSLPFAYFGTVGTDDFNYPELVELDEALGRLAVPHRLEVFEGDHDWAPADVCMRAIEWMELQAIRKSTQPADAARVDAVMQRAVAEAKTEESAERLDRAFSRYSAIASDFAGLRDVAPFEQKARQLAGAKQVKAVLAARRDSIKMQESAESSLERLLQEAVSGQERGGALQQLTLVLAQFRRESAEPKESAERMVARRVLTSAWIRLNDATSEDLAGGDLARATARLELMAIVRPDDYRVDYRLARVLARDGKKKAAIDTLLRAVKKGFNNAQALESETDFAALAAENDFRLLVARLKASAGGKTRANPESTA